MDGVTVKLRPRGFVSYVPPCRRTLNTESNLRSSEKESLNEKRISMIQEKDLPLGNPSPDTLMKLSHQSGKKSSKKSEGKCLEMQREYIPPGRRSLNSDLQKHGLGHDKSLDMVSISTAIVGLVEPSPDEEMSGTIDHILDEDKITKKARKVDTELPRGNYIPPARRALIAEEMRLDAVAEASGISRIPKVVAKKCDGFIVLPMTHQFCEENNIQDDYSVRKCSFIVRGLPPELPDYSKDRYLKPFCDRGAIVRWISPDEAILVFPTETIAKTAMSTQKNSLLQIVSLESLGEVEVSIYLTVSTEIYNGLKPERDCRVANRMIGAALGISLSKRAPQSQVPVTSKSPKKLDAWDD